MLTVVTWLWSGPSRAFDPRHPAALARNLRRHITEPHEFICITDATLPKSGLVRAVPTPKEARRLADIQTPEGRGFPSCYRRLWLFSREAKELGERFLALDLDAVIVGNIDHIARRQEPFVGWIPGERAWGGRDRFGGAMYLLTAGAHPEVYEDFHGAESIAAARAAGFRGSDQAWINACLWGRTATMSFESGIHMWRELQAPRFKLPPGACVVHFSGPTKPWNAPASPRWLAEARG